MGKYRFVVFKKPVKRKVGNPDGKEKTIFEKFETAFLPKEEAEHWIEQGYASNHLWICRKCGITHSQTECPYKCRNENCDNTRDQSGFDPRHPDKHYEMRDCIRRSFHFLTIRESRTTNGIGKIYHYDDGIYREEGTIGFTKELITEADDRKKNTYRNEVCHGIADKTQVPQSSFGLEGPKVALKNGILDLEFLEMEEFHPDKKALNRIPHEYNPNAECPKFKKALKKWIPSERSRQHLKELLGTALHPEKLHKKMGILVGPTDAGKSTLIETLRLVFGKENVEGQSPHDLTSRWGPDKIFDVLLNTTDEVRAEGLEKLDKLKKIADGNPIVAEQKGEKTYTFEPTCEHLLGANITPSAERQDNAFWNRWIPIEFPEEIPEEKQNPNLVEELKEEAQGILNWLIEGYRSFSENGNRFTDPLHWEEAREKWLDWGSAIQRFIQQYIEKGSDVNRIGTRELYNKVKTYADEHELPQPRDMRTVTQEFKKIPYASHGKFKIEGRRRKGFKGIRVTYEDKPQKTLEEKINEFYEDYGYSFNDQASEFLDSFLENEEDYDRMNVKSTILKMVRKGEISLRDSWDELSPDEMEKLKEAGSDEPD